MTSPVNRNNFYPHKYEISHTINETHKLPIGESVSIAGRVFSIRTHGKAAFMDLFGEDKNIQLYFKQDNVGKEGFEFFKENVRRGDFIGIEGSIFKTRTGEQTVNVQNFQIICKALNQLPDSWNGIRDVEYRYRNRHLDLLLNPTVRTRFEQRSMIVKEIRSYLDKNGFLEVETPIIQPTYGGANARPFLTHINALNEERYLQISPELYLKRLTIGGLDRIFSICRNFRNEDVDTTHNPEFTMMELYWAYADYTDVMQITEELIGHVALTVFEDYEFDFRGKRINFEPAWKKITMYDALEEYADLRVDEMIDEEIKDVLVENGIEMQDNYNRGLAIAELFDLFVQPKLIQPTFVTDYPKETTPLCKLHRENPELIERFELFVAGMELANAYTELNDPQLQESFFLEQLKMREQGDEEAHLFDEEFLESLKYGMPPTGGLGIGIDRLVMILTGAESIKEVILFPMLRRVNKISQESTSSDSIMEVQGGDRLCASQTKNLKS